MADLETIQRALVVERLCEHHKVKHFNSGDSYTEILRVGHTDTARGCEKDAYFVAHHGDDLVIGFFSIGPGEVSGEPAIWLSALATDQSVRDSPKVVASLLRKVKRVRDALGSPASHFATSYRWEAALVADNPIVERALRRSGFEQTDFGVWIRRMAI